MSIGLTNQVVGIKVNMQVFDFIVNEAVVSVLLLWPFRSKRHVKVFRERHGWWWHVTCCRQQGACWRFRGCWRRCPGPFGIVTKGKRVWLSNSLSPPCLFAFVVGQTNRQKWNANSCVWNINVTFMQNFKGAVSKASHLLIYYSQYKWLEKESVLCQQAFERNMYNSPLNSFHNLTRLS